MLLILLEEAPTPTFPWPWMLGIFAIVYFLMLRPQQKEQKKRRDMLSALKKDDKVMTSSGIFGQVLSLDEHEVMLKVDDNTKIRFTRAAIDRLVEPPVETDS